MRAAPTKARGAALLVAMLLVALVATLAAAMVWQQWRAVRVETAERARAQSALILGGALDWARLILREDATSGRPTALTEPWATPLQETRLSTFLAVDTSNADDAPDAFLSGRIADAQARYNLNNLVDQGKLVPAELATLQRLFDHLGIAAEVAERIAGGLRDALAVPGDETQPAPATAPLQPRTLDQLAWLGVAPETIERLRPSVVLLPTRTPINLNTAPREVLAAVIDGIDLASAERLVQARQRTPLRSIDQARAQLPGSPALDPKRVATVSSYFEVRGRLRLGDWAVEETSLVQRRGREVLVLQRERATRQDTGP